MILKEGSENDLHHRMEDMRKLMKD